MRILLVAATFFEIRQFLGKLVPNGDEKDHVRHYNFKNTSIDVLITGIGMVETAYCLGKQLSLAKYDLAINAGIGGSYREDLEIGEVVQVTEECIADLGAEDGQNFLSVFELTLKDPDGPPYSDGRLINTIPVSSAEIAKLKRVRGATVNTIHGNRESINKVLNHFRAEEESMEGAACFYAFLSEQVPFAEIRAISNLVEVRDKSRWNVELALKNLNSLLVDIFMEVCT
jgi:futalosine hydrolase